MRATSDWRRWSWARAVPTTLFAAPTIAAGLPSQTSGAGRLRTPVDGVFEDSRNGVIVLGRGEQDGVGGAHAVAEVAGGGGRIGLVVSVVEGEIAQVKGRDGHARGSEVAGRADESPVDGSAAEAAGEAEDGHLVSV